MNTNDSIPPGFTLRHILRGHTKVINRIAWSPNGQILASPSNDGTIRIWDPQTGQLLRTQEEGLIFSIIWSPDGYTVALGGASGIILRNTLTGEQRKIQASPINSVAWSPDGQFLAFGSYKTVQIRDLKTGQSFPGPLEHSDEVTSVAWSPDGRVLASGSTDCTIKFWNTKTGQLLHTLTGHSHMVHSMVWSPDGRLLASGSSDATIRLWNYRGRQMRILEGHTGSVICVSFSPGGHLLASKSHDGTVRCWRSDTWEQVALLKEPLSKGWSAGLAFHPQAPVLATLDEEDRNIRIWDLNPIALLRTISGNLAVYYTNAKVVLVGDTGVGKSGLGLVLTGQNFELTASTHGRHVWTFDSQEFDLGKGRKETRETLLWDLAGQPGYRITHQLHLNEVSVALIVFDARSETDPFMGVDYWVQSLRQAQRVQGDTASPMKIFLVAARIDRGGKSVSIGRIEAQVQKMGLDGYFETSAKEGRNIDKLVDAIRSAIDWDALPQVSSTDLFRRIKLFLLAEKDARRFLSTEDNLYRIFLTSYPDLIDSKDLRAQFETCVGRVESRGLIRRLNFGNLVLLQPELLDAYASALVNAVRDEPDGLGCIAEEKARTGNFNMPKDERLKNEQEEKLLLIAMIEDLLRYEVVLRESAGDGQLLVFPAQSTRENPDRVDPEGKVVTFSFKGPVLNVYATLAVRLSYSGIFKKEELWKNAITYTAKSSGTYGLFLTNIGEGRGELSLFFDEAASEEMRFHFEEYVEAHLHRRALSETIQRRRIFSCSHCNTSFTDAQITKRLKMGFDRIRCSVCDTEVWLLDKKERLVAASQSLVREMDHEADTQRDLTARAFIRDSLSLTPYASSTSQMGLATRLLEAKIKRREYDVFLCHTSIDKPEVKKIGATLKEYGIRPWLDEWNLRPGEPWQRQLERQITQIKSAAVFVGKEGIEPWQQLELEAFLFEFAKRGCPVIPVLLSDAPKKPWLPIFLQGMTWVDFRQQDPNPMQQLIWGITGERNPTL